MPNDADDTAALAAAVRALAAEVHRALAGAAADGPARPDEVVADLQQRAGVLLGRVGEGRLDDLGWWLEALQQRILIARWLGGSREGRLPGSDRARRAS